MTTIKAMISEQVNALPCHHYAMQADVHMSSADRTALRLERKDSGHEVPKGRLTRLGNLKIVADEIVKQPTVVCRYQECGESAD